MSLQRPGRNSQKGEHNISEYHRPAPGGASGRGGQPVPDDRTRVQGAVETPQNSEPAKSSGKKTPKGNIKPFTVFRVMVMNMLKALFVVFCIGLMIGSIMAVQLVQYVVEATENDEDLLDLENISLAQTTYFMIRNPDNMDEWIEYQQLVGDENRIWVSYDQIPTYMVQAMMATEDREFEEHHGVNIRRTVAALANEIVPIPGMRGGASTITQQLVKNITGDAVVADDEDGRTAGYQRKLREIFRAWGLENRYTKQTIMEAYLNTMSLSGRIAGVEAGAQTYFGKSVSELELHECAMIAGITQAPTRYSPYLNPENCIKRRNDVIKFMLDSGYITKEQAQSVWDMPTLGLVERTQDLDMATTNAGIFSYLSDKAYDDVISDLMKQKGYTKTEARKYLYNSGLRVYLTGDLNVQRALDDIMVDGYNPETGYFMNEDKFPGYAKKLTVKEDVKNEVGQVVDTQLVMPQASIVVINYDGELVATSGGIGQKESSLSLNRGIGTLEHDAEGNLVLGSDGKPIVKGTLRQVGSTMKPIAAYALGIDYGIITYSKTVMDAPVIAKDPRKRDEEGRAVKDWPSNYANKLRNTKITVAAAVAESTNTVAAQVGLWVGREAMFEFLRDSLQITSLVEPDDLDLAPLVLGAQTYGMSAYELAGAYMMFGGEDHYGTFNSLHSYLRVEDSRGNIVLEPEKTTMQAIDNESGFVMNRLLANVLGTSSVQGASPTAGNMSPVDAEGNKIAAVGKTGTTSDDNDRWFVGLTPDYITAVWWGYDQGNEHTFMNKWSPSARTNIPVNVWKTVMEDVYQNLPYLDPAKQFPPMPEGVVEMSACTISGDLAGPGCPRMTSYFTSFNTPQICSGHTPEEGVPAEAPPA